MRILIPCSRIVRTGGLLRFARVAAAAAPWGHEIAFCPETPHDDDGALAPARIVSPDAAERQDWDATMIPGAGFGDAFVAGLTRFRAPRYGVRVQHVLKDQSRRDAFLAVNRAFAPDLVIFNTPVWAPEAFRAFGGRQFHHLLGAVDTGRFAPDPSRRALPGTGRVVLGGQARKNAPTLAAALRALDARVVLRLFGTPPAGVAEAMADLVAAGRVAFVGELDEAGLVEFYRSIDIAVQAETAAGWSNLAAEAAASGVPLVASCHGTAAFLDPGSAAICAPEPDAVAAAVRAVLDDPQAARVRAAAARRAIAPFDWARYAARLIALAGQAPDTHYFRDPDAGLFGKWLIAERLEGLSPLFAQVAGRRVLDLGAAEGVIALACLDHGAARVEGFEIEPGRVADGNDTARRRGAAAVFRQADLSDWGAVRQQYGATLGAGWDVVLYLGLHHHLREGRHAALEGALSLARSVFAIRTPARFWEADGIAETIARHGFVPVDPRSAASARDVGDLALYRRTGEGP